MPVLPDRRASLSASGHPAADVDLADPVGLIETTDGGRTWAPLSRDGQSDFHVLTFGAAGILGYDGSLERSTDGRTWMPLSIPAEPHTLAAAPESSRVLATTPQGLLSSGDGGLYGSPVAGAPALEVVTWAGDTSAVGVDRTGTVWTSSDAAATRQEGARLDAAPPAVAAVADGGPIRAIVVTADELVESQDGRTFDVVLRG